MTAMQLYYEFFQAWLRWLAGQPWALVLAGAAIVWIVAQLLPNRMAGGYLFERRFAWISTSIAAVFVFMVFVVPNINLPLFLGLIGVSGLVALAYLQRSRWH